MHFSRSRCVSLTLGTPASILDKLPKDRLIVPHHSAHVEAPVPLGESWRVLYTKSIEDRKDTILEGV
jgi:hypothetical protein